MIKYSKNDSIEIIQHQLPYFTHQQFNKIVSALEKELKNNFHSSRLITGDFVTFTKKDINLIEKIYEQYIKETKTNKENHFSYSYLEATRYVLKEENK